jgi:hypothetical protein
LRKDAIERAGFPEFVTARAAENLRQKGARVDICPDQGFVMKNLVQQIKRALA